MRAREPKCEHCQCRFLFWKDSAKARPREVPPRKNDQKWSKKKWENLFSVSIFPEGWRLHASSIGRLACRLQPNILGRECLKRTHCCPSHPPESDPGKPLPRRLGFAEGAARYFRLRPVYPEGARQISPGQGDASFASVAAALGSLS